MNGKRDKIQYDKIQFAIENCFLGLFLAAFTDQGLCAILLGDKPQELEKEIHKRFPKANLIANQTALINLIAEIKECIHFPSKDRNFVLDERGTAFQLKVWKFLREIPVGTTASYTAIAHQMGLPKAVRAVANACGANPLAVITPCHRVIKKDGNLAGYYWGLARKQSLLQLEKISNNKT